MRAVLGDVYLGGKAGTELRVAILKRLREAGIQMANPQQDVHLRDLEWVKAAAIRVVDQRAPSGEVAGSTPAGSNDNS